MKKFYVKKEKNLKNNSQLTHSQLLRALLQSKSHYGAFDSKIQPENQKFVYGTRFQRPILNLQYTIQSIKRALILLQKILVLKRTYRVKEHKILIICNSAQTRFFRHQKDLKTRQMEFISEEWVGGFLTNPELLQKRLKHVRLLIALNTVHDDWLIKSAMAINLPLISVTNTHISSNSIHYPIFINLKNVQSTFFLLFLFKKYLTHETKQTKI